MWGDHDQVAKTHGLVCTDKALKAGIHHEVQMLSHPLLFDANGDYIADLFGCGIKSGGENGSSPVISRSTRSIWSFSEERTQPPTLLHLKTRDAGTKILKARMKAMKASLLCKPSQGKESRC